MVTSNITAVSRAPQNSREAAGLTWESLHVVREIFCLKNFADRGAC
jgi:hypothetical protein